MDLRVKWVASFYLFIFWQSCTACGISVPPTGIKTRPWAVKAMWSPTAGCCCCSAIKSCLTLCIPMDCSMTDFPVLHYLPEFAQTHVHWVSDAIQPSQPLSPPSHLAFSLSQHHGLFQWVGALYQVAKVYTGASGSATTLPMNIKINYFL